MNTATLAQKIFETVAQLPTPLAQEVLDFADFIAQRAQQGAHKDWHDLQNAQTTALADVWDNQEDEVWNGA